MGSLIRTHLLMACVVFGLFLGHTSPAFAEGDRSDDVKQKYGCITVWMQWTGKPVAEKVLSWIHGAVTKAVSNCSGSKSRVIRVSVFQLHDTPVPEYAIERKDRYDIVPSDDPSAGDVLPGILMGGDSPVDLLSHSAGERGLARIFKSKKISQEHVDCLLASFTQDGASILQDITLFKIATGNYDDSLRFSAIIDDAVLNTSKAEILNCVSEFRKFGSD